jgi:phage gpG-like protein
MLSVEIDDRVIMARLNAMPGKLRSALLKKTYELAEKLKSKVQQNLTNQILQIRTGKLSRSIFEQVTNSATEVSGRVYSSGVAYAKIQEFGGQTKAHIIEAVNGKALAFKMGGKDVFFKRVNHPGSKIPAHHYMGQAFDSMKPEIVAGYQQAVAEGTK